MDREKLSLFLQKANKATYANKLAVKAPSSRPESEDYHFELGDFTYHDTYFWGRDFIGAEIVYFQKKSVWGMNYFGFVLHEKVIERDVYDFLRQALMQEYSGVIPVRGPKNYRERGREYRLSADGPLDNFSGREEILFNEAVVYRCLFHGGMIR